jgi:UDP-2,3-diacylglucosamine pyrophosphatase LpxH
MSKIVIVILIYYYRPKPIDLIHGYVAICICDKYASILTRFQSWRRTVRTSWEQALSLLLALT